MFRVSDIEQDVKRVLGACSDEDFFRRLNQAVEILSTEGDWDPLFGFVDICSSETCVVLPREVGTVLAVNVCDRPTLGHDWLFSFHLNGPGTAGPAVEWHWSDRLPIPVFRQPNGGVISAMLEKPSDTGKTLRVYGYDLGGKWIRTLENGSWVDGFLVPLQYGSSAVNPNAPRVQRIERVSKDATSGYVRLYSYDGSSKTRIAEYAPDERDPGYRAIHLSGVDGECRSLRVAFKKGDRELTSLTDLVPLHSKYALVLMCKALRKFDEDRLEEGEAYQRKAVQLLTKRQLSGSPPTAPSFQVSNGNLLSDRGDRMS